MNQFLNQPWAILPERLETLSATSEALVKSADAVVEPGYENQGGVAVIPIMGVLTKNPDWWEDGTAMNNVKAAFRAAVDDPSIHSIVLFIDSPGGTVDGTQELASVIEGARGQKPVIAYTDGMMASAAYWIGSAADKIYISGDTVDVGSIGVVCAHIDISKLEDRFGVKVTEIYAGKYKRIASEHAPLSDEGRASIQDRIDTFYGIFVDNVARNRGITVEKALEMADGKLFIGQSAVDIGLVDGKATLEQIISNLQEEHMTQEELKSKHPSIYQAIIDEGKALGHADGYAEGFGKGKAEGAQQERARIQDVEAQTLAGHESLIAGLKFDGKTTGAEAAVAILAAERTQRATAFNGILAEAPVVVTHDNAPIGEVVKAKEDDERPIEEKAKADWDKSKALREEFGNDFSRYLAYAVAAEEKKFKVLSK